MRRFSYSEIAMALTCEARWDFAYGGHLAGGHALKRRVIAPRLSDGRAWGAAVAAWHSTQAQLPASLFSRFEPFSHRWEAHHALIHAHAQDVIEQLEAGVVVDFAQAVGQRERLGAILDHYIATAPKLANLTRIEGELDVAIPSRAGGRRSSRYRFHGFLDGFTIDEHGNEWLVENKLRDQLTPKQLIQLSRQILWYAWARQQETDRPVVGVIVEERLNEAPKPARIVNGNKKGTFTVSHNKSQLTTPENYIALCQEFDVEPHDDVVEALGDRVWQQRVPITFRASELAEAGQELVSAAQLIRDLDSGARYPIRNGQHHICRACQFKEICANPRDDYFVHTQFEFTEPKRLRTEVAAGAHGEGDSGSDSRFDSGAPSPALT